MRFGYHPDLVAKYPTLSAGVIFAHGVDNATPAPGVEELLAAQEARVRASLTTDRLSSHPHIAAWRAAFSAFGVKPSKYRSAVESLLRQVLRHGSLPRINKLVDLCNAVSLKHVLPVAACDVAHIRGDVTVRLATGDETFVPLYATEAEHPRPGEVIYTDEVEALSRRWVWRQCEKTRITEAATDVLLTTEGVNDIPRRAVEAALDELAELVQRFCGGELSWHVLDAAHPWAGETR